jgi:probable HAF family extracellular repeat protein
MASTARPTIRRRLRLAVAGAVMLTSLTAATAAAAPTLLGGQAPAMTRPGASPDQDPRAGSPPPGFLWERGRFKPVAIPRGLEDLAPQGIAPIGINDRGQIVGTYGVLDVDTHGFLLDRRGPRGRFTKVDVPGAKGTQPQGINDRGQIVGKYSEVSGAVSSGVPVRGFVYDRGRYVRLDFPGARSSQAFDINDHGQVVGEYTDANGAPHGYVWERGRFRSIEAGGALAINNRGQITGVRQQPDGSLRGFLLDGGRVTTFSVPGAQVTVPYGINDHGQVVGVSASSPTATTGSGFLRDPRGRVTAINRPGAAVTVAFDINNRRQVVGVAPIAQTPPSPPASAPPMGKMA